MPDSQYLTKPIAPDQPRFRPGSMLPKTPTLPTPGEPIEPTEEDLEILRCIAPVRNRAPLAIKLIINQLGYFNESHATR